MATEGGRVAPADATWRESVRAGLALCLVVAAAWLVLPPGHPGQAAVAVGAIYGGALFPASAYLYLREVGAGEHESGRLSAFAALVGWSKARLARLPGRVVRSRRTRTNRTCPCEY
ncbi:hypothetical protein [Haloarchaeobius amylolyticus]|uniref:hypothetical protein n=1 Tax=Haloarchaeobius amylolyticus TaxID=1198296 RepID=UPI0022716FE6|nr:hypothetical protein [Haloarchaeobius amylolyticus]